MLIFSHLLTAPSARWALDGVCSGVLDSASRDTLSGQPAAGNVWPWNPLQCRTSIGRYLANGEVSHGDGVPFPPSA
jgi:hypothetical protein